MKQANAGTGIRGRRCVCESSRGRQSVPATRAIFRWRAMEVSAESPCEDLVARESDGGRDGRDRLLVRQETGRRPFEPKPEGVPLRRFTCDRPKRAVEVKRRPTGTCGQGLERDITIEIALDVAQQLQNLALTWHRAAE